jgi:hypothetical protein|nr:MAG TPA: ATP synthase B/B' [Caudoviricetes sp.]
MTITDIIISAFTWAFFFVVFFVILLNVLIALLKSVSKDIFNMNLDNEQRKFNNLEKLSKEIEAIEKSIDERSNNLKLMIAELRLERCKKAYKASKKKL